MSFSGSPEFAWTTCLTQTSGLLVSHQRVPFQQTMFFTEQNLIKMHCQRTLSIVSPTICKGFHAQKVQDSILIAFSWRAGNTCKGDNSSLTLPQ